VTADLQSIATAEQWEAKLREIDCRIGVGQSTAVVVDLRADAISGASVGDSRAWIIHDCELIDLTTNQIRKPLLGSGEAQPVSFSFGPLIGTLIVATDGFCNYVKRDQLTRLIAQADFLELPAAAPSWFVSPPANCGTTSALSPAAPQRRGGRGRDIAFSDGQNQAAQSIERTHRI